MVLETDEREMLLLAVADEDDPEVASCGDQNSRSKLTTEKRSLSVGGSPFWVGYETRPLIGDVWTFPIRRGCLRWILLAEVVAQSEP